MFTTKQVSTQTLGEFLAGRRAALGLTPQDVVRLVHVQPKFLAAFEDGRFEDLPANVYVKGFLKNLGMLYRVDSETLISQFLAERGIENNLRLEEEKKEKLEKFSMPRFVFTPKTITWSAVVLLVVASLAYFYFQINSLRRPPHLELTTPAQDGTVETGLITVEGKTEAGAYVYLNDQSIVVDADGVFRENLSLAPGFNQFTIRAINKFKQESLLTRSIVLSERNILGVATATAEQIIHGPSLEILIGPKSAWINISVDGHEEFSGVMLPETKKIVNGSDRIILTTGNAGSTRVIFNGQDMGVVGKDGETVRDLEFGK